MKSWETQKILENSFQIVVWKELVKINKFQVDGFGKNIQMWAQRIW